MTKSPLKEDPMWLKWMERHGEIHAAVPYDSQSLVTHVNDQGHVLLEKAFDATRRFERVLEVGAGTGYHLNFVRHGFGEYIVSDIDAELLEQARKTYGGRPGVSFAKEDALNLSYADNSFDRLVSVYNLEHLPQPHLVLREWERVVKPDGILSVAIPAEGGVAWRLGRFLTTRRTFARKYNLDLDYIIAREHINPAYNLISLIRHYFKDRREHWYPCGVPLLDINLVYACTIRKCSG
jgi:SAM-dependent methyltransferase